MASATTTSYHVAGPIGVQASVGTNAAYVTLGWCQDGADIKIEPIRHEIKFDGAGGPEGGAAEHIALNAVVTISYKLVPYAGTYIDKLRAASVANIAGTSGALVAPGTLYGTTTTSNVGLYLPSSDGDGPWCFPTTIVVVPGSNKVSPKETVLEFIHKAFVYLNGTNTVSIASGVLWTRAAPS